MSTEPTLADAEEAIEEVYYQFHRYTDATDLLAQASALVALQNAVSDLASYHAGYEIDSGTMPYERDED
ncbi:hypothetical protein SEA_ZOOMAN_58 [Microbacterium phage Zooman]|nr:hypothetical protein SEA_ZOOMAN_58 [Microbacterium phage Zooman]